MAEEQGQEVKPDGSGEPAGTPGEPKAEAQGEGAADKAARLEAENTALREKYEKEHQERLANLSTVQRANQALREIAQRAGATDSGPPRDPEAVTAEDVEMLRLLARHDDPYTRAVARAQLAGLQGVVQTQNEIAIAEAPDAIRKEVREAWRSGNFRTVAQARAYVETEAAAKSADPLKAELDAAKKRIAELENSVPQVAGTHTRPLGGKVSGPTEREKIDLDDYTRIHADPNSAEARRLWAKEQAGLLDVV